MTLKGALLLSRLVIGVPIGLHIRDRGVSVENELTIRN